MGYLCNNKEASIEVKYSIGYKWASTWHYHLFSGICVSVSPCRLGGHWAECPIHTVLSQNLQGTRRNSGHFGGWSLLLVLSHYWVDAGIVLFRWSKAWKREKAMNHWSHLVSSHCLLASEVLRRILMNRSSQPAWASIIIVFRAGVKATRKTTWLLLLSNAAEKPSQEPLNNLLPVNAVLWLFIYLTLCTFIRSERPLKAASISKIISWFMKAAVLEKVSTMLSILLSCQSHNTSVSTV